MNIDEYLHKHRIHKSFFAKQLGVTRPYIHHMISGAVNPSAALANKIVEISNGEITLEEVRKDKGKPGKKPKDKKGA